MRYDYLIVGAGLFGCVFAREMTDAGKKCLVIDSRPHIGGNIYCADIEGVCVHRYGAHIFHTADEEVWQYASRFVTFNNYINSPVARNGGEMLNKNISPLRISLDMKHNLYYTEASSPYFW